MNIFKFSAATIFAILLVGCTQTANFTESEIFDRTDDQIELQYGMARMLERKKMLKEARDAYLEILDSKPNYAPALHRLGVVSVKLNDLEKGIEYFEMATDNSDEDAELLADYGYALFLSGDSAGAKLRLNSAREIDSSNQRFINNLAIVVGSDGETEKSLELFRLVNSEANALCNIGFVMSQNGQYQEAKDYFHRSLDMNPKLKKAANGLIQIHQRETSNEKESQENTARSEQLGDGSKLVESSLDVDRPTFEASPRRGDVLSLVRQSTSKDSVHDSQKILDEDATVETEDK